MNIDQARLGAELKDFSFYTRVATMRTIWGSRGVDLLQQSAGSITIMCNKDPCRHLEVRIYSE